jgi:outer membrane receptor protein involved in Fe transport
VQNELAPLLNLQPSEIQLQSILASYDTSLVNETGTAFDPASQNLRTVFPGVITLDLRYNNISVERVRGLDVQIDSELETQLGLLSGGFNGSYVLQHERRITETSSWASLLNIPGRPVDFRFRANAGLARGAYSGFIYLNYTDHYEDRFSDPVVKIKSWTTVDMTFRFSGKDAGRLRPVGDLSAAISVTNVFDKAPPAYFNTFVGLGYDPTNADPIGRTMSVRLVKQW